MLIFVKQNTLPIHCVQITKVLDHTCAKNNVHCTYWLFSKWSLHYLVFYWGDTYTIQWNSWRTVIIILNYILTSVWCCLASMPMVFGLIDQVLTLHRGVKWFHIGGDEVKCSCCFVKEATVIKSFKSMYRIFFERVIPHCRHYIQTQKFILEAFAKPLHS